MHCKRANCDRAPHCGHEVCPCTPPEGIDLGRFNASHGRRFNHFRTRLLRELCVDGSYMRGVEPQDGKRRRDGVGRMGLHDHLLLRTKIALTEKAVRALAIAAGYGHSVKVIPVVPGSKAEAEYVSKYVCKGADSRRAVPWVTDSVDYETGEVTEQVHEAARYRTWSCSQSWGLTMAVIRQAERERWIAGQNERDAELEDEVLAMLSRELGAVRADESPPPPS